MTDNRAEYRRRRYQENRERLLKQQKEYNEANRESISAYQKKYKADHQEEISLIKKEYYKKNKRKINTINNKRDLARRAVDPAYKLRKNCSCMIWQSLKGNKNNKSILSYLLYTMEELKTHLESKFDPNMSWDNYGTYWHIDHIMPQSSFIYTSMADENFQKCWALANLQPLKAIDNIRKSNKIGFSPQK